MEKWPKTRGFFRKYKPIISTILTIIFLVLTAYNGQNPEIKREGTWYVSLIGESYYLWLSLFLCLPLVGMIIIGIFSKRKIKDLFESKFSFGYRVVGILILIVSLNLFPSYYDIFTIDEGKPTFESYGIFGEIESYTLEDVSYGYLEGPSDMWIKMNDGKKIYVMFGISISSNIQDHSWEQGKIQLDLVNRLSENNIAFTIKNRSKVDREIKKYQGRSNLAFWHIYLPGIVENIS